MKPDDPKFQPTIPRPAAPASRPGSIPGIPAVSVTAAGSVTTDGSGRSAGGSVAPPAPAPDPYVGTTIDGRYRVESVLGEGGMGVVYLARHKVIDKRVAIKVLRADMAREKEITERFLQEAKAASSIGNPHIIDISDFGTLPDGSTYFVMEFLDGKPLTKALEETRPMPVQRLVHVARQIADALSAAHQRGIVHRDLKPDNIFLIHRGAEVDFVKILDFGIAKVSTGATSKLTRAGSVFGTPHYMSPEQAAGSPVDLRTDIYALGVILYEMASGRVPFDADNFMGILTQHMYKAPVPIRALVPPQDVPPGLEAIVLKALSKKPEQRYSSMDELAQDLEKLTRGMVPDAVPEMMGRSGGFNVPADFFKERGMPEPVPAMPLPGLKRTRWGVYAGVAGVLAAIGIVVAVFAKSSSSTARSNDGRPVLSTAQPAAAPSLAAPADTKAAPPAPTGEVKRVLFGAEPSDAHVFVGDLDMGTAPVSVDVAAGRTVAVEVRREGFKTYASTIDGTQPRVMVRLTRMMGGRPGPGQRPVTQTGKQPAASPAAAPAPAPAAPAAPLGGGDIVNPWAR
jgi:eukaryotic-like serine/threonine-protein kinase